MSGDDHPQLSGLTDGFGKDSAAEARLGAMNALLAPLQSALERDGDTLAHRPVFILGPPRSGTTVLSQLLSSTGLFGVATNFVARFWRAPTVGMTIARALGVEEGPSHYRSRRGATEGWGEPSEFGYFWSRWFDLGQATHALGPEEIARFDAVGLRRTLASMERAALRPLAFKNNTWFTLNPQVMASTFPGCVLVACDRDPLFVAQSLWLQRLDLYGDLARWWSVRPADYASIAMRAPLAQVAAQATSIRRGMHKALAGVAGARIVSAPYERLAADPRGVVREILRAADAPERDVLAALPDRLESTDVIRMDRDLAQNLKALVDAELSHGS